MKNIAVIGGSNKVFQNYFESSLESLKIQFSIADPNSLIKDKHLNYVVINDTNSCNNDTYKADYCLVNMDSTTEKDISIDGIFLSYGIGGRNTITVSSLLEDNFVYCIQRYLNMSSRQVLEPQEIPINIEVINEEHMYSLMAAITIALIEGASSEEVQKQLEKIRIYVNR